MTNFCATTSFLKNFYRLTNQEISMQYFYVVLDMTRLLSLSRIQIASKNNIYYEIYYREIISNHQIFNSLTYNIGTTLAPADSKYLTYEAAIYDVVLSLKDRLIPLLFA